MIGLIAAQGGGLSTGREGPFVHVACCVAAKLWRVPYFRSIAGNDHLQRQMLAAAVAAGVTGVFGAPISGLFFGMEVTSTYLLTTSLWRCMVCAVTCKFFADLLGLLKDEAAGFRTTAFAPGQMSADIIAFAALGAFCGILGSLFVYTLTKVRSVCNVRSHSLDMTVFYDPSDSYCTQNCYDFHASAVWADCVDFTSGWCDDLHNAVHKEVRPRRCK